MILGMPSGSSFMADVARAVPPPPPSEMTAWMDSDARSFLSMAGAALAMAAMHSPRSWRSRMGWRFRLAALATWWRVMSTFICGSEPLPRSMRRVLCPSALMVSARNWCSIPLESSVPMMAIVFGDCIGVMSGAGF